MKDFISAFKTFAFKGNVLDLAIAVVIGTAFGKIVASLVADIITPIIGIVMGGLDFTKLGYTVKNPITSTEVTLKYGNFIQSCMDFVIVALALFVFMTLINKAMEKMKKSKAGSMEAKKDEVMLLEEIRDLLKKPTTAAAIKK